MTTTFADNIVAAGVTSTAAINAQAGINASGQTVQGNANGSHTGTFAGPVTGNVIGGASLMPDTSETQNLSGDGAITIKRGAAYITKGSIAALTLAAPTAGTDDFKFLFITSTTAFAHVITSSVRGFNGKGSSGTLTWAAAKGNSIVLMAYNGDWWVFAPNGVTVA